MSKKVRTKSVAEAVATGAEPAALAARDLSGSPVEPDPQSKGRLLMKPASSAASDSGQQREKEARHRHGVGSKSWRSVRDWHW